MRYAAGVDLGTTYTAAAVFGSTGLAAVDLGISTMFVPSVVAVREGGAIITGTNAQRRLVLDPARVAREFKRRLGDPTPLLLGGVPYGAETLSGYLLRSVIESVTEGEGEPPAVIGLSHPAHYGSYKLGLLEEAARIAGTPAPIFVPEPVAAAVFYAQGERVDAGDLIAVYDLGGGTFDASVVRSTGDGFELVGCPDGMDRFGGIDMDEAVLGHVRRVLGDDLLTVDDGDPAVLSALSRLRDDCRRAKEALSGDTDVEIPVMLPGLHTEVRLTRAEFEDMIRPRIRETIDVLERTIGSAGIEMGDVARVLLVGGSSRIPLVGEMVRQATGRPIGLDAHPKLSTALGTARVAHDTLDGQLEQKNTGAVRGVEQGSSELGNRQGRPSEHPTPTGGRIEEPDATGPSGGQADASKADDAARDAETVRAEQEPVKRREAEQPTKGAPTKNGRRRIEQENDEAGRGSDHSRTERAIGRDRPGESPTPARRPRDRTIGPVPAPGTVDAPDKSKTRTRTRSKHVLIGGAAVAVALAIVLGIWSTSSRSSTDTARVTDLGANPVPSFSPDDGTDLDANAVPSISPDDGTDLDVSASPSVPPEEGVDETDTTAECMPGDIHFVDGERERCEQGEWSSFPVASSISPDDGVVALGSPTVHTVQVLSFNDETVGGVAFNHDGTLLAAGFDETVRLWDPVTGDQVGEPLTGHTSSVTGVAFNHDGTLLASAGRDETVRLWDPVTGDQVGEPLTGHTDEILRVAFNHDGTLLASAGFDETVRLWDPVTGDQVGEPLTGHTGGPVQGVAFNHDGTLLASAGAEGAVRLWDPVTGDQVGEPLTGHSWPVWGVAFNHDGTLLASCGYASSVRLWDPVTGDQVGEPLTRYHSRGVGGDAWVAFNHDGTLLASAGFDETVALWDPVTGDLVGEPLTGHTSSVTGVAFNHDGTQLASSASDRTVRLWDLVTD